MSSIPHGEFIKCLAWFTTWIWVGMVSATNAPAADDTVVLKTSLLVENFEGTLPPGWDLDDAPPQRSGWKHVFGNAAFEGRGFLEIRGFEPNLGRCVVKTKVLRAPRLSAEGFDEIQVSFRQQILADLPGDTSLEEHVSVHLAGEHGESLTKNAVSATTVENLEDGWMLVIHTIPVPLLPNPEFSAEFRYVSTLQDCPAVRVDALEISGLRQASLDTVIVEPADIGGPRLLEVNENVRLRAAVPGGSADGVIFQWQIIEAESQNVIGALTGETIDISFPEPGLFAVLCAAVNSDGAQDPTPDTRFFLVARAKDLDTVIVMPEEDPVEVRRGDSLLFQATSPGIPENRDFLWAVVEANADQTTRTFLGPAVDIPFPEPGLFIVLCSAQDGDFADPSPARRTVLVLGPRVKIVEPRAFPPGSEIVVPSGEPIAFQGLVQDPEGIFEQVIWVLNPGERVLCEGQDNCTITFQKEGLHAVAMVALGKDGPLAVDFVKVLVDPPLFTRVLEPLPDMEIPVNQPFALKGEVTGTRVNEAEVFWLVDGQALPGPEHAVPGIPKPGHYRAKFIARIPNEPIGMARTVHVFVFDPAKEAVPQIIHPKTDLNIPPGETVFFDSSLRQVRRINANLLWEIRDAATRKLIRSAPSSILGRVAFPETGVFEVKLFLRDGEGNHLVDQRIVTVGNVDQNAFGDNVDVDRAASIGLGRYDQLALDRANFFEFTIPEEGLTLQVTIATEAPLRIQVFDEENQKLAERQIEEDFTLQLAKIPPGTYKLGFLPEVDGKRRTGFSFGVEVLNPALYFTDITEDEKFQTTIGMVNTTNDTAAVEIIAYDKNGAILAKRGLSIAPLGSFKDTAANLFPESVAQLSWIRVDSTRELVGYSRTVSIDDLESYAISSAQQLHAELFVPHIAQTTETWFTRANVVNGQAEAASPLLLAGNTSLELENQSSYTKDSFDFLQKLGGSIPAEASWGMFLEQGQSARLAGSEVFGKVDGTRQIVGLGLSGAPRDNPNFTAISNRMYFTHIANAVQFWTGIALVNIDTFEQAARVFAYGADGSVVGEGVITLAAQEKRVQLADAFLAGIADIAEVAWIEVEADANIVGYELFGTWDNKQMAGLEAITTVKKELCFPFVEPGGLAWHGIALVNVADNPAQVTFRLYDDVGNVVGVHILSTPLAGKEKKVFLLASLFENIPLTAAWLEAESNQEIAGFELFGPPTFEHMSGLIAQ